MIRPITAITGFSTGMPELCTFFGDAMTAEASGWTTPGYLMSSCSLKKTTSALPDSNDFFIEEFQVASAQCVELVFYLNVLICVHFF